MLCLSCERWQIMLNIRLSTAPSVILQNSTELPRRAPLSARTLGTGAVLQINDFEREAPAALLSCNAVVNRATCPQAAQSTVTKSPSRRSESRAAYRASIPAPGLPADHLGFLGDGSPRHHSRLTPRQITAERNTAQPLLKLGWATVACGGSKNKRRGTARIDLGHRVLILPT